MRAELDRSVKSVVGNGQPVNPRVPSHRSPLVSSSVSDHGSVTRRCDRGAGRVVQLGTVTLTEADLDQRVAGRTVPTEFLRTSRRGPGGRAPVDGGRHVRPADVRPSSPIVSPRPAAGLRSMGVGPGDRVVLMMRNIPEFHWVDLAVAFLGATPGLDLQLVVARAGPVPRRPLRREGRDRGGRGLPRALPEDPRRAPSLESIVVLRTRPTRCPTTSTTGRILTDRDPLDLDDARARSRSPTISPRSSTPRAPPATPRA